MSIFSTKPASGTARLLSAAASDNATVAIARPASLLGIQGYNARASAVYCKIYDKLTAPASTDTPRKTLYFPASSAFAFDFSSGVEFTNGIGYRLTTGSADNDVGALTAADVLGLNFDYA